MIDDKKNIIMDYVSYERMNQKQKEAYSLVKRGYNVFITGGAGTGKTYLIKNIIHDLQKTKKIGATSMTGCSALLINGTTLHSYLGIGITKDRTQMIRRVRKYNKVKRWKNTDILIIDEVSMLSKEMLESIESIARELRRDHRPFGGLQVIFCGDFCQLGCIDSDEFCFESELWDKIIHHTVVLQHSYRQENDMILYEVLNKIRFGDVSEEIKNIINQRVCPFQSLHHNNDILPTRLFPYRKNVKDINDQCMQSLKGKRFTYPLKTSCPMDMIKKWIDIQDMSIVLCVGAQVILTINLDIESGLVNGSRGVVKDFTETGIPIVAFLNGQTIPIDYFNYKIEDDDHHEKKEISYDVMPLIHGWAITIHKSQGMTLDCVETDLWDLFDYGQGYVTLSRVRRLNDLWIKRINYSKIKCHPKVKLFYNNHSSS